MQSIVFSFCYQWLLITWYRLLDWLAVQRYANIVSANFSFQFDFVSSENSKFPRHNAGACQNRSRSTRHDPSFDHRLVSCLIELSFVKISILRSLPFGYQLPIVVTHTNERRWKTFLISHNYEFVSCLHIIRRAREGEGRHWNELFSEKCIFDRIEYVL